MGGVYVANKNMVRMNNNLLPIQGVLLHVFGVKIFCTANTHNMQRIVCFFIGSMQVAKSQTGSSDVIVPVRSSADLLHFLKQ